MGIIRRVLILFFLIILLFCTSCSVQFPSRKKLEMMLDSLTNETDEIVYYMFHNKLYASELIVDFDVLLKEQNIDGYLEEVFCIKDSRVWFLFASRLPNKSERWYLASVLLPNKDFSLHYEGDFCFAPEADSSYTIEIEAMDYSTMNGFYVDDKIILTDKNKLVEVNISTGEIKEYFYKDYIFKSIEISVNRQFKHLIFSLNNKTKNLDFIEASHLSQSFNKISQFAEYKIHDGSYCLDSFFSKVQMINGHYYIFGRILNWHGETYMVVFEYDFDKNELKYLFNQITYDVALSYLYVVPKTG